jgi:hypothetical protein
MSAINIQNPTNTGQTSGQANEDVPMDEHMDVDERTSNEPIAGECMDVDEEGDPMDVDEEGDPIKVD